jgi:capsid protein
LLVDESSSAKQGVTQLRAIAAVSNLSFGFINRDFEKVDK